MLWEVSGWAGAGCLLLAYALLSAHQISPGPGYQLLNLAGSAGLAANAVVHQAWPSATLNVLWLGIGLAALHATARAHSDPAAPPRTRHPDR